MPKTNKQKKGNETFVKIPRKFIFQRLVVCFLHGLHCQFSPPQQLFSAFDFLYMNLAGPVII